METYYTIYNVICPILACILYWRSGKKNKPVIGTVFLYFALSSIFAEADKYFGVLHQLGNVYYLVYSLFAVLFVFKLCSLSLRFNQVRGAMSAFICALVMFLIFIINTGVHYEYFPLIFESYIVVMTVFELILLSVCLYSSRVLHGLHRYFLHRRGNSDTITNDIRRDMLDRSCQSFE